MSRLQVGGLALYIPDGSVFELLAFICDYEYKGKVYSSCWRCKSKEKELLDSGNISDVFLVPAQYLMPLGDKQTQDELREEQKQGETL